jgi:hypothetical protein
MLGFDDEIVDLIAKEARRHSDTCIQLSVLIKARFNERLERCDKTGNMFSSVRLTSVGIPQKLSRRPLC